MNKKKIRDFLGVIFIVLAVFSIAYILHTKTFNENIIDSQNEYNHVKELTSDKYQGRLAGTEGNKLALKYVEDYFRKIGVKPGGDNGSYYQNFKSMVPTYGSKSYIKIEDNSGVILKEYSIGKDYVEYIDGYGGIGQAKSQLFYMKDWIRQYKPADLKNKILVVDSLIGDNDIEYAIDKGVKGILCPVISGMEKKPVYMENKPGKTLLIQLFDQKSFNEVKDFATKGMKAEVKLDEPFKMVDTPNLIGKIQGRKKGSGYIVLSSHIDGYGTMQGGIIYPGAMDGASGTAIILELARVISEQKNRPDKTIIFALWNNEEYGMRGKQYYAENPVYPMEKSTIIYLNNLGGKHFTTFNIGFKGESSQILMNKMMQFVPKVNAVNPSDSIGRFIQAGATAISLDENLASHDGYGNLIMVDTVDTPGDNLDTISETQLKTESVSLLQFIKKEVYGDVTGGLINNYEKAYLLFLGIGLVLIYLINTLNRTWPDMRIFNGSIEDVFYSIGYNVFQKFIYYLFQTSLILISIIFVTHIPFDFNLFSINGGIYTNFSWNEVLVRTEEYLRMFLTSGFGKTSDGYDVMDLVGYSFSRSFKLLLTVMIAAVIIGILKGLYDAFKDDGRSNRRAIGTIFLFSVPDVFIVIMVQMLFIFLYNHNLFVLPTAEAELKQFIISFLSLILLPTIYVTRIAAIAVHEEMKKEYIKAARAKGLSNLIIIKNHLLISIFIKVIDALPSILSLIISNLIIVEYLSNYKGIVSNMMISYDNNDIGGFTGLALSLCFIYIIFILIIKFISGIINPLKRREIR